MCTFNVRTLAFDGKNGIGHSEVILKLCQELGCDVIGLQETRRDGQSAFTAAGYTVFCSGAEDSKHERKRTHGVGLAVRESIVAGAVYLSSWMRTPGRANDRAGALTVRLLGAYGRDKLNDNGKRLLHAADNNLALLNTFFATPNRGVSYTF